MKINVTDQSGKRHELDAIAGWQIMEIIRDYGLPIKAECGGSCCCATCHVYVTGDWLDKLYPMRDDEDDMLDETFDRENNSRLSCQLIMSEELDGIELTLSNGARP
jgi:2Fe-2S ferredoxin